MVVVRDETGSPKAARGRRCAGTECLSPSLPGVALLARVQLVVQFPMSHHEHSLQGVSREASNLPRLRYIRAPACGAGPLSRTQSCPREMRHIAGTFLQLEWRSPVLIFTLRSNIYDVQHILTGSHWVQVPKTRKRSLRRCSEALHLRCDPLGVL